MTPFRLKTYIINLPKEKDRKDSILKETAAVGCLDCEVIEAVYGKELCQDDVSLLFNEKKFVCYYSRTLLPGEIGTTLSHRKCYNRLLSSVDNIALIVEDDITFVKKETTYKALEKCCRFLESNEPRILLLHANFNTIEKGTDLGNDYSLYPVYDGMAATAYLINRNAARILLETKRPFWVADDWYRFRKWGIQIYSIYPFICLHPGDIFESSILNSSVQRRRKRVLSWITFRLIYEKICRMALMASGRLKHFK